MNVLSKSEFAQHIGVTPTRVGQLIREGKIGADALVGEGRFARIRVDLAKSQIGARTDVGQRLGNGLFTNLTPTETPQGPSTSETDRYNDAIKNERLRAMRMANERTAEERLAEQGRYVRAADTQAALTRVAATMLNVFEGSLGDIAAALAAKFSLPARDVLHLARTEFRAVRAKAAETLTRDLAQLAPMVEDLVADASDPAAGEA